VSALGSSATSAAGEGVRRVRIRVRARRASRAPDHAFIGLSGGVPRESRRRAEHTPLADQLGDAALNGGTHGFSELKHAVAWCVPAASTSDSRRLLNKPAGDALIQQVGKRLTRARRKLA
jgi:hypothetical protein